MSLALPANRALGEIGRQANVAADRLLRRAQIAQNFAADAQSGR